MENEAIVGLKQTLVTVNGPCWARMLRNSSVHQQLAWESTSLHADTKAFLYLKKHRYGRMALSVMEKSTDHVALQVAARSPQFINCVYAVEPALF